MPTNRRPRFRQGGRAITPEAVAAYKAGDREALHTALRLRPWEFPTPLDIPDRPYRGGEGSMGALWWPECRELRRQLEEAVANADE